MMEYYILPQGLTIAMNHKVATSSIAKAIVKTYYPEIYSKVQEGCIDNPSDGDMVYRFVIPKTEEPMNNCVLLIREPVERFISAGADINKIGSDDLHYAKQSDYSHTKIFKYPSQIPEFCVYTGLPNLETINVTRGIKPILAPEDQKIVEEYYADDIKLFKGEN